VDEENCKWCSEHGAILVTHDRGRGDRTILEVLAKHRVHAIFVHNDLRTGELHHFAKALLAAEGKIDHIAGSKRLIHHRLQPSGALQSRYKQKR
jgi:hypothetical protein